VVPWGCKLAVEILLFALHGWHDCRRSFASQLVIASLRQVQEWLASNDLKS
jgi:hypothetical protein